MINLIKKCISKMLFLQDEQAGVASGLAALGLADGAMSRKQLCEYLGDLLCINKKYHLHFFYQVKIYQNDFYSNFPHFFLSLPQQHCSQGGCVRSYFRGSMVTLTVNKTKIKNDIKPNSKTRFLPITIVVITTHIHTFFELLIIFKNFK